MKVLLVEDHTPTRLAICKALRRQGHEVFQADGVKEALLVPVVDVAVVDLHLNGELALQLIKTLTGRGVPCLALTNSNDSQSLLDVFRCGAKGYLLKSDPPKSLFDALEQVVQGQMPLSPCMTHHLLSGLSANYPYRLEVCLTDEHADLMHLQKALVCRFQSEPTVALLYTLARQWKENQGWVDDIKLGRLIWGRRFEDLNPNNLNVLIHRVRAKAKKCGFEKPFVDKRPGATRLLVCDAKALS